MILDHTIYADLISCPEFTRLRHIKGYDFAAGEAASAGTAWHAAQAEWFEGGSLDQCLATLKQEWPRSVATPQERLIDEQSKKSLSKFEKWLREYAKHFPRENDQFKVLASEEYVETHLPTSSVLSWEYCGIRDLLIEDDTGIAPMDHKTTGSYLNDKYIKQYEVSAQMKGYVGMERVAGRDCFHAVINALCTYDVNLKKSPRFLRFSILFRPEQIDKWARDVEMAYKLLELYHSEFGTDRRWPQFGATTGKCNNNFGQACPARELCHGWSEEAAEVEARTRWTVNFWNPKERGK